MTLFYYIFSNGNNWIKLEGSGKNPSKCKQVKFTCNEGNEIDLKIINDPISDYITAYSSVLNYADHPGNLYILANKFGYLLKYNYIYQENNFIPFNHNKTLTFKKAEKTINVKATSKRKAHKRKITFEGKKPDEKKPIISEEKRISTGRVNLQGNPDCPSILAGEVRIGDVRLFNQGEEETIINIIEKTPKTLIFTYSSKDSSGENYK